PAVVADAGGPQRRDRVPRRQRPDGHRRQPHPAGDLVGARRLRRAARGGRRQRPVTDTRPAPAAGSTSPPSAAGVAAVRRPARVRISWLLVVIAVLVVVVILSVTIGSRTVTWDEIGAALGGSTDGL